MSRVRAISIAMVILVSIGTACGASNVPPVSTPEIAPIATIPQPRSPTASQTTTTLPTMTAPATATVPPTATISPTAAPSLTIPPSTPAPSQTASPTATFTRIPPTPTNLPTATATLPPGATCQQNPNGQITYIQVGPRKISEFQYLQTLSGNVYFYGTADRPNFWYYKIESSTDRKGWTIIGHLVSGRTLNNELAIAWDTTLVPNGNYWVRMMVVDKSGGYYEPCEIPIVVNNVAPAVTVVPACQDANSELSNPKMDQITSGQVNIYGSFHRDNLAVARLQYSPDKINWTQLQQFNRPLTNELLYIWKTDTIPNGDYWIRILVIDKSGNYNDPCTVHIIIKN